jgi:hypothetical protein
MKALSQNLGHDSPLTTLGHYGKLTRERQGEVLQELARKSPAKTRDDMTEEDLLEALASKIRGRANV